MFCTNCGSENNNEVKFCVKCGKEVKTTDSVTECTETVKVPKKGFKKWLSIGIKIVWLIILVPVVISALVYAYQWYEELPREANKLGLIEVGMKPVEVTLELGKPDTENRNSETNNLYYIYSKYGSDLDYYVVFDDEERVRRICTMDTYKEVMGLGVYDSEEKVLSKYGQPSKVSVNSEGTRKTISFSEYRVAFEVEKNKVRIACVTTTEMTYSDEYQGL